MKSRGGTRCSAALTVVRTTSGCLVVRCARPQARQAWRCAARDGLGVRRHTIVRHAVPGRKHQHFDIGREERRAPLRAWRGGCRRARHAGSARRHGAASSARSKRVEPFGHADGDGAWRASRRSTGRSTLERRCHRCWYGIPSARLARPWKCLSAVDQFIEVGLAEREPVEHSFSICGSGASIRRSNSVEFGRVHARRARASAKAAEQEIHFLRAAMRRPPQRPAAAHAKIIAGHDWAFLCRAAVRASAPVCQDVRSRRRATVCP